MSTLPRHPPSRVAVAVLTIVLVDLASKWAAQALHASGHTPGWISPLENPEYSLGLAAAPRPIMLALSAGLLLAFGGYCLHTAYRGRLPILVPVLLLGGATANLLDRLNDGAVEDFLATPWVIVNLADLAVLAGLLTYTAALLHRRPHPHPAPEAT